MSIHIEAKKGEVAEKVLLSGDPLRAKFIAENLLENVKCYNSVRNMLGYTGLYKGKPVSVQGTGMGQPSLAIYVHELINSYSVKKLIRIGTCGALLPEIKLSEIILAQGASTDSSVNRILFNNLDYAPIADFGMLLNAYRIAGKSGKAIRVGGVFSTDLFYFKNDPERWSTWIEHNILCVDMETSMLYTMASGSGVKALSILTVSDNIITGESSSSKAREREVLEMSEVALEVE